MRLPGRPQGGRGRTNPEYRRFDSRIAQKGDRSMNNDALQPAVAIPATRPGLRRRILWCVGNFLRHARQRWYLYLPIIAIWSLAYVRLFIDATPRVPILFNWTPSLPYRVAWLQHGPHPL